MLIRRQYQEYSLYFLANLQACLMQQCHATRQNIFKPSKVYHCLTEWKTIRKDYMTISHYKINKLSSHSVKITIQK